MSTPPSESEKLPARLKLVLALGEFAPSVATGTIIPFYFLYFLTDVAGVRPGLAGSILLVARLWDAINDPLVGNLSDRTHSRMGRRRPFMLYSALPMAALYSLLWIVPPFEGAWRAVYYLAIYVLFDTAFTLATGPCAALTPEVTLDADERTTLITWRMAVSIITGLAAAVAMPFIFEALPSRAAGFAAMGVAVGVLSAIPFFLIVLAVRERPEFQQDIGFGFFEGLRFVFRNRPFWLSISVDLLAWTAIAIVEAVFVYYLIYWSGVPQEDTSIILGVILGSAALFLPLVNFLAERFEKKWAYIISTATWMVVHLALWFVPAQVVIPVYVIAFLAGLGVASAHVLPGAMEADVLESVELDSGQRQEGVFTGVANFVRKLGVSVALFVLGWVLELTGYVENAPVQTPAALTGIRVLIAFVPLILLALSLAAAWAYPITHRVHAALLAALADRRVG